MARTFSSTYTTTQSLTNPATDNPATVTGAIDVNSANPFSSGLFGTAGFAWTVTNLGTVESTGTRGLGILLQSGGFITNGASGTTSGYVDATATAIQIEGTVAGVTGTVVNFGTIKAVSTNGYSNGVLFIHSPSTSQSPVGTVTNYGTIFVGATGTSGSGTGVQLAGGGIVTNFGLIDSAYGTNGSGVGSFTAPATVINKGTIEAAGSNGGVGVSIAGGSVNNTGLISGTWTGISLGAGPGTLVNSGTVTATRIGVPTTLFVSAVSLGSGTVINGTAGIGSALISAYGNAINAFSNTAGTVSVVNRGIIQSTQTASIPGSGFVGFGVATGGSVVGAISNFGTIRSTGTTAGAAINLNDGGTVSNAAGGLITGPNQAISTFNAPSTVLNAGGITQTGSTGSAVFLGAGGTVSNTGTILSNSSNSSAVNFGTGGGEIINGMAGSKIGLISAYHTGVSFFAAPGVVNPGTLTVVNYGRITSTQTGTAAGTGSIGFVVQTGTSAAAVVSNFGTISSAETDGGGVVLLAAGGSLNNAAGALISGPNQGVNVFGAAGTVVNAGSIAQTGSIGASAAVLSAGGTIVNSGVMSSAGTSSNGVGFGAGGGKLVNQKSGLITAYHNAVGFFFSNTIVNPGILTIANYGQIQSTQTGPAAGTGFNGFAINTGTSSTTVIDNFGTIAGFQTSGGGGILLAGGKITNEATGVIDGHGGNGISGLRGAAPTTITNHGIIRDESSANSTIYLASGGIVTNTAGALISATERSGIAFNNTLGNSPSIGSVVNAGSITTTGTTTGSGVYFGQGGVLTNLSGGVISAYRNAVSIAGGPATVTNSGSIENTGTPATIYIRAGGMVTNNVGALINSVQRTAISFNDTVGTTVSFGTVVNKGTIVGGGATTGGAGVYFGAGGVLSNAAGATISSAHNAVSLRNAAGTVDNSGKITSTAPVSGTSGAGVYLAAGGVVTNRAGATITALRAAVSLAFQGTTNAAATVTNLGTLFGDFGLVVGPNASGNNTLVNTGVITGTGGSAVAFGSGDDLLIVNPGAVFRGSAGVPGIVDGGAGTDEVDFTAAGSPSLAGFEGFETIGLATTGANTLTLLAANFTDVTGGKITVNGGNGNDTFRAGGVPATDFVVLNGGPGDDTFWFSATGLTAGDTVAGGPGNDTLSLTTSGALVVSGVTGVETFTLASGGSNNLTLTGANFTGVTGGKITANGGGGGNMFDASALSAANLVALNGGAGADTFIFSAAGLAASDIVAAGAGADQLVLTTAGNLATSGVSGVETYTLSSAAPNTLTLTSGNFTGVTGGKITVNGGALGNTIRAGGVPAGDLVVLNGGVGSDIFVFSATSLAAGDVVAASGGADTLVLVTSGTIAAGGVRAVENYQLASTGANTLSVVNGNFVNVNGASIQVLGGSAGNTVDASLVTGANRLVFIGGAGADHFTGGAGNDIFQFSAANLTSGIVADTVAGGGGNDQLAMTTAGTINASGVTGVETYALASTGANTLTVANGNFDGGVAGGKITVNGGSLGNRIDASGLSPADLVALNGSAGADVFVFSATSLVTGDVVAGGAGADQLTLTTSGSIAANGVRAVETYQLASTGANTLTLGNGNFTNVTGGTIQVTGGSLGNTVDGSAVTGANKLVVTGGAGDDIVDVGAATTMTGGTGNNRFVFSHVGINTITDFGTSAGNKIVLRDAGFDLGADEGMGTGNPQNLDASVFIENPSGTFAAPTQRFAYNTMTGNLRYDADGSDLKFSPSSVAVLTGHPALSPGPTGNLFFAA